MRYLIIILLLALTGCSQQVDLGGGVITKEFNVGGERVLVGGEQMLGADKLSADFKPEVKLEKWGDETYVKVWSEENGDKTATQVGDKVIWNNTDKSKEYNFYTIEDGFEYEIILKEKPKSNVIELKIETKDLVFYYQPELTQEEIDDGVYAPDNVFGSYAVYHTTKRGHIVGQTNYMAGKAFHIYRPQIEDANGWKVWGDLLIENGILSVTIPQDFLDKAVYPIKHATGLTFGFTSVGGYSNGTTGITASKYDCPESGTITSITTYAKGSTGGIYLANAVYSDDSGADTKLAEDSGNVLLTTSGSWKTTNLSLAVTATTYWLAQWGSASYPTNYFDLTSGHNPDYNNAETFESWPDPFSKTSSYSGRQISIYATYTAGEPPADTCTYSSGDWNVNYSDDCDVTADTYVDGDLNLFYDGAGSFDVYATLGVDNINASAGAVINVSDSGSIQGY